MAFKNYKQIRKYKKELKIYYFVLFFMTLSKLKRIYLQQITYFLLKFICFTTFFQYIQKPENI